MQPVRTMAQGDQLQGMITKHDDHGQRWYQPFITDEHHVIWPSLFTPGSIADNGDGTDSISAVARGIDSNAGLFVSVSSTTSP